MAKWDIADITHHITSR